MFVKQCEYTKNTQTYIHFARKKDVPFNFTFDPSELEMISSSHTKKATIGKVISKKYNR